MRGKMPVLPLREPFHQPLYAEAITAITSPFLNSSSPGSEGTKSYKARTRETVAAVVPVGADDTGSAGVLEEEVLGAAPDDGPAVVALGSDAFFLRSSSNSNSNRANCSSSSSF